MKVLKFGGTSVGTVDSLALVKEIVENTDEQCIVVVSALGGVTDMLITTANMAAKGDMSYLENFSQIIKRHNDVIAGAVSLNKQDFVKQLVCPLFDELSNIYKGVSLIKDLSQRTLDIIVSYGERLSSLIISNIIKDATWFDSCKFIKTEQQFNKHIADLDLTNQLVRDEFESFHGAVAIVPGFISSDKTNGDITNLGRGGSDYTAAIICAALDANVLQIWTDVDGFMTADPKVIKNAYVIDNLTFGEAMELCNFGAKVIYPPTIYPVCHKDIPIVIKNTFNPNAKGTLISAEKLGEDTRAIKGISSINDTCLITVAGLGMVGVVGINSRLFKVLANNGISVFLVSQASSEQNTSFAIKNCDADLAVKVLEAEFSVEMAMGEITEISAKKNLATVAIVGENMKHTPGVAGRLFNTLGRNGINVMVCAQGASETNISFVIEYESLRKALNVIHDSFFLSETQVLNVFIVGVGNIGRNLIKQIKHQQDTLKSKSLTINIVGVSNSKHCIFDRDGIDVERYKEALENSNIIASPENIASEIIKMNIFNSVFVDCTASQDIANLYPELLSHNVNVVAANKIAASSQYQNYINLKNIARKKDVKFLFETNVGAGLPVINTINGLINSGDVILKIEAVISGTLNYIFNVLSEDIHLSQAIRLAKEQGYSEPDPREDLSGKDVIRKIVILSREAGYQVEIEDVVKNLFIPAECFEGSLDDFFTNVEKIDAFFEKERKDAASEQMRFRFVAKMEDGKVSVGLEKVGQEHPFYSLESSNNVILITTERYKEYPMEIKGYGAGAEVTAAGVFADIISIANIR